MSGPTGQPSDLAVRLAESSNQTFIEHIADSPYYLPEIAFVGGAIGGLVITSSFITKDPKWLLVGTVVGGVGLMYGEYLIWTKVLPDWFPRQITNLTNDVVDVIGPGFFNSIGTSIQAVRDWFGNPDNEFDIHYVLIYRLAVSRGFVVGSEGGFEVVRILTANQKIVYGILSSLTQAQIISLLKREQITFNGYPITEQILQQEADTGVATINGVSVRISGLAGSKIEQQALGATFTQLNDNTLESNGQQNLREGQFVYSPNLTCYLVMQGDGNAVIYNAITHQTIWASHTSGKSYPPYELKMQGDGNLVIYAYRGNSIWSSGTSEHGISPFVMSLENNGELKITDLIGDVIWTNGINAS